MAETFSVEILRQGVWKRDLDAVNALVGQLLGDSDKSGSHTFSTISHVQGNASVMVIRDGILIIGLGVFSEKSTLTRKIGWIDDLIVDRNQRGRGVGKSLMMAMIEAGRVRGLERLNCTCRPEKVAANNLCLKVGFKPVGTINGTNFYTLEYEK